jgi:RNA polymerase sigma factor (sigma-70 family)
VRSTDHGLDRIADLSCRSGRLAAPVAYEEAAEAIQTGCPPVSLMWSVTDDALLAGMAAGDAEAASAFVARFQRRVFGLALTITRDRRMAEDVAQEALVRAWRHGAAYDARRGSVATWLLTITRNLAIDAIRVRRPVSIDPEALLAFASPAAGPQPSDVAVLQEDVERLRSALADLPVEQQRAVALAGLHGFSGREVAEHEGIPLGTAKTRIRAAMLRLRSALVVEERAE